MWTAQSHSSKAILLLFWLTVFALGLIVVPNYLGLLISGSRWTMLGILGLGVLVITLYFSDLRFLVFFTFLALSMATGGNRILAEISLKTRWVFLGAMAAGGLSHWVLGKTPVRFRVVDLWMLVFIAVAFYSQTYSILPSMTFERTFSILIFYLAVFWGVWNYSSDREKSIRLLITLLYAALLLFAIGFTMPGGGGRFAGFFANPNSVGIQASILMPIAAWSFLCEKKRTGFLVALLIGLSLFLSMSRAGILATAMGAGYFLFNYFKQKKTVVIWLLFFVGAAYFYVEIAGATSLKEYLRWNTLLTGSGRQEAWTEVMHLIKLRPWLGYGFGTEDFLFETFDIFFYEHSGAYAHNSYIGLASQVGLVGAVLFFIPLAYFVMDRLVRAPRIDSIKDRHLHYALNGALIGGMANAFFESWLYSAGSAFAFPFWVVVAIALRLDMERKFEKTNN